MGKYEYQTLFEEAIKHGVAKEEYSRESSKMCIMTWIANELAEANRLKRIELGLVKITNLQLNSEQINILKSSQVDMA